MQLLFQALTWKPKELLWNKMVTPFNLEMAAIASATLLSHPHADVPTALIIDALGILWAPHLSSSSMARSSHWPSSASSSDPLS